MQIHPTVGFPNKVPKGSHLPSAQRSLLKGETE
jgi:hypothetical protein